MVKTRFAPSPTGFLHLGNARTALFSALLASHEQGTFLLRIEDTDQARSKVEYDVSLQADLLWLGIAWNEGPHKDLGHGPYYQAQRQDIYEKYYQQLLQKKLVYPCFCSEMELALARKTLLAAGKPPKYTGTCARLSAGEAAAKLAQGITPSWRFRVPLNQAVIFADLVRGEQKFLTDDIGDFVIRRAEGTFPFLFTNAIDDALMQVTHVMRGEDHVANTPRQLLIMQALQLPVPAYAHLPLIVGDDNTPLSKRHGSWSVADLRSTGYLPGAVINYIARLGHYYSDNNYLSFKALGEQFAVSTIGRAPARFDLSQLQYWQKQALQHTAPEVLWDWIGATVHTAVPAGKQALFLATITPNILFPQDAEAWMQCLFTQTPFLLETAQREVLLQAGYQFFNTAIAALEKTGLDYNALLAYLTATLQVQGKKLFQPLRVALTGRLHGPDLPALMNLMGQQQAILRLQQAMSL